MRLPLAVMLLLCASPALAANWTVDAAQSSLTFTGNQAGQPFIGRFKQFSPMIDFDEAHPAVGHISATIAMASAHIDDKEQNDALPTRDWFFTDQFSNATFQSTVIRTTGDHRFAADGTLTLRGVARPITLPFTLNTVGDRTRAEGETILNRHDFGLGGTQWQDDRWIAYPVRVHYIIVASRS